MGKLDTLDRIFSEFIRRRDSDENGYGRCISCGKIGHWKTMHNGHYVNRKHMSLRYDEKNCNMQCPACNSFDEGNMLGYHKGLVAKYGPEVIDYLEIKKHNFCKLSQVAIDALKKEYKQKIKELG